MKKTGIDDGHAKAAASRIGISLADYLSKVELGLKWCFKCKEWHDQSAFGKDSHRTDGLSSSCLASRRVENPQPPFKATGLRRQLAPIRDGDKKQARRRVNYLVEQKRIPHPNELPCADCGDEYQEGVTTRHEYDHARGYDGENQLYVEPVCTLCHAEREKVRNAEN